MKKKTTTEAVSFLGSEMNKKEKRVSMPFDQFLEEIRANPTLVLRNIFQIFHDMVKYYVGEGEDEYPDDPESIGFVRYDCSKLFVEGSDNPFFADRLFANRFMRGVGALKQGAQQNQIYIFEGPHGCGKSTFFNNLIKKLEEYTEREEGRSWEIFWAIDKELLQAEKKNHLPQNQKLEIYCPSHDHPILLIPKNYRVRFLDRLLDGGEIKEKLTEKEYEWIFKEQACTICKSLFWSLFDKLGSLDKVLNMVHARAYKFDRRLGEGVSVFNPGDKLFRNVMMSDRQIQQELDNLWGANLVKFVFSRLARTHNGIYCLMDIKGENKQRLLELHNVISEGVHKVGDIEERVNSLFFAVMNPEDKEVIKEEKVESFEERIRYVQIPYVLEPQAEVKIYRSIFGSEIDKYFLPRVMENFARVIISTRMEEECEALSEWIGDIKRYEKEKYCDGNGLLLRMEIYSGIIPPWLSDEDRKSFRAEIRRKIISGAEKEGKKGFSGRDSIRMFRDFIDHYVCGQKEKLKLVNMKCVDEFFKREIDKGKRDEHIPQKFLASLLNWYDYTVLNEMKEALYFYNKERISKDILNFLFAVNYELGSKEKCGLTGEEVEVTIDFLKLIGSFISGEQLGDEAAVIYASEIQRKYAKVVAQELQDGKAVTETELYGVLFDAYVRNVKEGVLKPFIENKNFREAVKSFKTRDFKTFDTRIRDHVAYMIKNLVEEFGYTEQGAKEICFYVIDNNLAEKFS